LNIEEDSICFTPKNPNVDDAKIFNVCENFNDSYARGKNEGSNFQLAFMNNFGFAPNRFEFVPNLFGFVWQVFV